MRCTIAATPSTSSWLIPPAGSSSSSRRGFATSARASSTRFCVPNGSAATGADARRLSPTKSIISIARFLASASERSAVGIGTAAPSIVVPVRE